MEKKDKKKKKTTNTLLMGKRSGERNADIRIHVPLQDDTGGSTRQKWTDRVVCGLYSTERDKAEAKLNHK